MKTLRIAQIALATILAVGINANAHAFMAVDADQPAEVQMNLTETIDLLRAEIDAGETNCNDMLAKLDTILGRIDAALDNGVANEDEYLEARDVVSKMRYELECVTDKMDGLVQFRGGAPAGSFHKSHGGHGKFGGHGGGGIGGGTGGGALGGLVTVGLIGGAIAGVASDSSSPGVIASPSN